MKKRQLSIENILLVIGLLIAFIGSIQLLTQKLNEVPQDEVVTEDVGFAPVLVPRNSIESASPAQENTGTPNEAPEIENQINPDGLNILPTEVIAATQSPEDKVLFEKLGPAVPDRIVIPKIGLDAPVIEAGTRKVRVNGQIFEQYTAPDEFAAGWHPDSALLGSKGNTVLNGHHNVHEEVFGKLVDLEPGAFIYVYSASRRFVYVIANKMILPELGEDVTVEQRLENARWIMSSSDERLTLVTCWPAYSNTHRLIIVARPVRRELISTEATLFEH
jgi:LPXTG-site transpeptidase (sortase) family protein